jgi:hypothetical protein
MKLAEAGHPTCHLPGAWSSIIQRDLTLELPDIAAKPDLTGALIQDAIAFNRRRYSEDSIRQIQEVIGAQFTGVLEARRLA